MIVLLKYRDVHSAMATSQRYRQCDMYVFAVVACWQRIARKWFTKLLKSALNEQSEMFNNRYQALDTSVSARPTSSPLHWYASLSSAAASLKAVNAPVPVMLAAMLAAQSLAHPLPSTLYCLCPRTQQSMNLDFSCTVA